jgi:uncharacterized protein YbcI
MPDFPDGQHPTGTATSTISRAIVRLLHEYTGRGPTKARTTFHHDLITVLLEDTLTMGERSLIHDGKSELVLRTRRAFQETMGPQMIAAVERCSGRRVQAFLSANHLEPDLAIESFVLAPREESDEAPSATAA